MAKKAKKTVVVSRPEPEPEHLDKYTPANPMGELTEQFEFVHPDNLIVDDTMNPRAVGYTEAQLQELADKLFREGQRDAVGVNRNTMTVIYGAHRVKAVQLSNSQWPEQQMLVLVRYYDVDEQTAYRMACAENTQRKSMSRMDIANAARKLMEDFGHTQRDAAKALGVEEDNLGVMLKYLALSPEIQQMIHEGELPDDAARAIVKQPPAVHAEIIRMAKELQSSASATMDSYGDMPGSPTSEFEDAAEAAQPEPEAAATRKTKAAKKTATGKTPLSAAHVKAAIRNVGGTVKRNLKDLKDQFEIYANRRQENPNVRAIAHAVLDFIDGAMAPTMLTNVLRAAVLSNPKPDSHVSVYIARLRKEERFKE